MGRATRWLKGLLGMKKDRDQKVFNSNSNDLKDNKGCSFGRDSKSNGHFYRNRTTITSSNTSTAKEPWQLRSSYYRAETEEDQNKHAIAVAAATAAAADAAVASAQAAVAVVRLTSQNRGALFNGSHEILAALKIQKFFKGYLARKALRALKGLVKLQALVRGYLVRKQAKATLRSMQALIRAQATVRARTSMERLDDTRSDSTALSQSRRLFASLDTTFNTIDESPKIVEVDTSKPKSKSRRKNTSVSEFGDYPTYQSVSSPILCRRISTPNCWNFHDSDRGLNGEECRYSTAQSTPRLVNSCGSNAPVTPAKSVCGESFFRGYDNFPNYMANTKSFKAKLRSHSAPKQRPETVSKKRLSLHEMMESRGSLSGIRMQRSCSQAQEAIIFKNAVVGRLDRSSDIGRESERNYFQRRF